MANPIRGSVPCLDSKVCGGVKNHKRGTVAKCRRPSAKRAPVAAGGGLSATPAPSSTSGSLKSQMSHLKREDEMLSKVQAGYSDTIEVAGFPSSGNTKLFLDINNAGDSGSLYRNTDNPVTARIETESGQSVYAWDNGSEDEFEFSDGRTVKSWVHPCDKDGGDISWKMTSTEFKNLERLNHEANEIGFSDNIDPDGELTPDGMVREVVARVMSRAK